MILVLGSKGLLGSEIVRLCNEREIGVIEADLPEYDILNYSSLKSLFESKSFSFVINCAAYTDVQKAEIEKEKAYALNVLAVKNIAELCASYNKQLIHFSTDFIFDGKSNMAYLESDPANPQGYYGYTKLLGEKVIQDNLKNFTIFRLQWLYGDSPKTFFSRILQKVSNNEKLLIVDDEFGSPCSVTFVGFIVLLYLNKLYESKDNLLGEIYNLTHNNYCSRYQCTKHLLKILNIAYEITPIYNMQTGVNRPKFGVMNNSKLFNFLDVCLDTWEGDLELFYRKD